ncbi:MAG: Gfo/Idh/MocA family protein [Opitutales bacterium]
MAKARFTKPSEIKVGVVGYGGAFNMGRKHLAEMRDAGMTPTAVCELDPERLKVAEEDYPGIETYSSVAEMLKHSAVDLVTIITPHNTHAPLGLQCLKAGRHVVCEKPMAITTAECDQLIAEANKRDRIVSTYHNRHWDGCIMKALEIVQKGTIGEVIRFEAGMCGYGQPRDWWRTSRTMSGGIMYDWGVHLLEYALQIITAEVTEVSGYAHQGFWADKTPYKDDTNEDEASALVRFSSGQQIWLRFSTVDMRTNALDLFWITGTKGKLCINMKTYELTTRNRQGDTVTTKGTTPEGEQWRYYQNVSDHLAKGTDLVINGEFARRPIHILDLAVRSARKGQALKTKYP